MIYCKPFNILFLKTVKVGGSSFEVALSKYCGDECVITRCEEDYKRENNIGRGCQNFGNLVPHTSSNQALQFLGDEVFDNATKIVIDRDPVDRLVSQYFFEHNHVNNKNKDWLTLRS